MVAFFRAFGETIANMYVDLAWVESKCKESLQQ
jgi:hypothetical protein